MDVVCYNYFAVQIKRLSNLVNSVLIVSINREHLKGEYFVQADYAGLHITLNDLQR